MATFQQNIANIRGNAIYGPDMRESIAEAIEQAIGLDVGIHLETEQIDDSDYRLIITEGSNPE